MEFKKLLEEVQFLMDSSENFKIMVDRTEGWMRTVIVSSIVTSDVWFLQSSIDYSDSDQGVETKVDMVRLSPQMMESFDMKKKLLKMKELSVYPDPVTGKF